MPSSSIILVSPEENKKPASILNAPSSVPQSASSTPPLPTAENSAFSHGAVGATSSQSVPQPKAPVASQPDRPTFPSLTQQPKSEAQSSSTSLCSSGILTPPLLQEEEAKKAAATQAEKLNEKISKVKGKVVVSSNKNETKPTSSLLSKPENHEPASSSLSDTRSATSEKASTPNLSESTNTLAPATASSHHKQPSIHAHFLLEDVVHSGTRSRSSSLSRSQMPAIYSLESGTETIAGPRIKSPETISQKQIVSPPLQPKALAAQVPEALSTVLLNSNAGSAPGTGANATPPSGLSSKNASGSTFATPPSAAPSQANNTSNTAGDPRLPQDDGKLHILLAATGSISTGKLRLIIHKLTEIYGRDKAEIQIILTKAAENFVSRGEIPSHIRIWRDQDEWATWKGRADPVVHIELRRWGDILVIAPLSANTLGKIALGLCDNLLTSVVRAWNTQYPILIAPAMVSYAYNHPATRAHLKVIRDEMKWIEILKPVEKVVGSYGDIGMGGMMDWNEIVNKTVLKLGGYPEDEEDGDDDNNDNDQDGDEEDEEDDEQDENDENDENAVVDDEDDDGTDLVPAMKKKDETKLSNRMRSLGLDQPTSIEVSSSKSTTEEGNGKAPLTSIKPPSLPFDDDDVDLIIKKLSIAERDNLDNSNKPKFRTTSTSIN